MWGVFKGHMGPPSYVVHVWESCQDKLTTKYIRGKLLTDNVSGVDNLVSQYVMSKIVGGLFG
jgi:hypothetical protein